MARTVPIATDWGSRREQPAAARQLRRRASLVTLAAGLAFILVAGQLARLATSGGDGEVATLSEPIAQSFARPDIVDRNGRLMATDVEMPSLFADPSLVLSRDEVAEKLATVLPSIDQAAIRASLEDSSRRFVWLERGLAPRTAQTIHDLGLPGLSFRDELRRAYPLGDLAGHTLGYVNVDNKGLAGIERFIDETVGVEAVHGATLSANAPVRLSLDIGVEHGLEDELAAAIRTYEAAAAAGLVMDVRTGELLAAVSLPGIDPSRPTADPAHLDRIAGSTFELGSIWKTVTIAMALDAGEVSLDTVLDVTKPLVAGTYTITDLHPAGRPLTVTEVFTHSSNVGAGMLAIAAGPARQQAFLDRLGLMASLRTEAGPVAAPQLPQRFERVEQITVSYGHGIAVAPIQFAAAAASLINGGKRVQPTLLARGADWDVPRSEVVSAKTSAMMRDLLRRNVTDPSGTGKRADVPGYRVGGKTGTADIPRAGSYATNAVIASFLAAFPMDAPQYLVLVMLFEPKGTAETHGETLAGLNAAPTAGRVIERIAPLLGVVSDARLAGADNP